MQLFASLPSLPRMPLLQYTACMTVASYSAWLAAAAATAPGSQLMPQLLQMLTAGTSSCISTALLVRKIIQNPLGTFAEELLTEEPRSGTASTCLSLSVALQERIITTDMLRVLWKFLGGACA